MSTAQHWLDATVHALRDVTPTVREFTLKPRGGVRAHQPGGHLQIQVLVGQGAAAKPHTRSYSLIGQPDGEFYRIAVKRLDEGRGGSLAMWRLGVGDRLPISEPQNHFPLDLNAPAYLLVAGGIGVTPLIGMAQLLARRGARVRMVFGARSEAELAYLPALKDALQDGLQLNVTARGQRIDWAGEIAILPAGAQMYVCGPSPMLDAARRAWALADRPLADLRYETFGSSGRFAPQAFRVKIERHGLDIVVPADCSLLDALEMAGVQALYDCRRGECGLCAMDVLSVDGEIDHRDVFLGDEEKQHNRRICVCVSRAVGCLTLDSAYRPER
jgi:vanillate O-demethylase ferredoxin subunit